MFLSPSEKEEYKWLESSQAFSFSVLLIRDKPLDKLEREIILERDREYPDSENNFLMTL